MTGAGGECLEKALAPYRQAFATTPMPMPMILVAPDGTIALGNAEFENLFELGRGEAVGRTIESFVPSEHRGMHRSLRESFLGAPERRQMGTGRDLFAMTRTGRRIPVEIGLHPVEIDGAIWTLASVVNISRRREIARELHSSRKQLQTVLDTVTNGIIGLAFDGRIEILNPTARQMLGNPDAIPPFDWPEGVRFLGANDLQPVAPDADPLRRVLAGERLDGEIFALAAPADAHRSHLYVQVSTAPVEDQGASLLAVLVLDDVTRMEEQRQQFERAGRLDALGQLTGGIAHDFNNLLAMILYGIELVEQQTHSERIHRVLRTTKESVERGSTLTQRMLAFAKRQPGLESSRPLNSVLADLCTLARPAINEGIELTAELADEHLGVFCDQSQLDKALLNIVLNASEAIRSSGQGSRITMRALGQAATSFPGTVPAPEPEPGDDPPGFVRITISDDGPGMSAEVKRRAIDPFFTTKRDASGRGLGLSMVYGFTRQSGGDMRISSSPGAGTTVELILRHGAAESAPEVHTPKRFTRLGKNERILLVEDEPYLLETLDEMLKEFGFATVPARTSREALDLAEGGADFDLLLSDIRIPGGIGGFELAKRLRLLRPGLPVVYMSGYTGYSPAEMGEIEAPLLAKPCEPDELARTLRTTLDAADKVLLG